MGLQLACFFVALLALLAPARPDQIHSSTSTSSSPSLSSFFHRATGGNPYRGPSCKLDESICSNRLYFEEGSVCCGRRCVNTATDFLNCGMCNLGCLFGRACCSGRCVNLNEDRRNCGSCGHACPFRARCFGGVCGYGD